MSPDEPVHGHPGSADRPEVDERAVEDLTETIRTQTERIRTLETMIELAPVGIGIVDLHGRTPLTNDTLRRLLGYSAEEFASMPFSAYSHPIDDAENLPLFDQLRQGRIDHFAMEKRFIRRDGQVLWTALTVSLVRDDDGNPAYGIGMTEDITERRALEEKLRAAEQHYRLLVERVPAVVYTADAGAAGRWHYVSPQIEALLGYTPAEWMATRSLWLESVVEEDRVRVLASEEHLVASPERGPAWLTYRMRHRDGQIVWVRDASLTRPGRGGVVVLDGVLFDVTQEKALEAALERQAKQDPLTGLVNRGHFRERVDQALAHATDAVAMLFIDLDGFKAVNDTLGHGPGDIVLASVARRLAEGVPQPCVLARLGGDEFAVLVLGQWTHRLPELAHRLIELVREPVVLEQTLVEVGASIGGALAQPDDTTDSLLLRADQAMYRAKSAGGERFVHHED